KGRGPFTQRSEHVVKFTIEPVFPCYQACAVQLHRKNSTLPCPAVQSPQISSQRQIDDYLGTVKHSFRIGAETIGVNIVVRQSVRNSYELPQRPHAEP